MCNVHVAELLRVMFVSLCTLTAGGEKAEDEGWLLGTSELQLQLHNSESPPIRIDTLPDAHRYSVKVQSMNYCAKTVSVNSDLSS